MRITNQMMTNNVLLNINRNKEALSGYEEQLATGKKIQKPSDDPIVAVRALRFRTTVSEIEQYTSNAEDAKSWISVTEQAVSNVSSVLQRIRELSVQASSDSFNLSNRKNSITEISELTEQFLNEANASYAGRYVFGGYKTNTPVVFKDDSEDAYEITESFSADAIETIDKVVNDGTDVELVEATRIRLGYDAISNFDATSLTAAGFTVSSINSDDLNAYSPGDMQVNILEDTGEIVFNADNTASLPDPLEFTYERHGFEQGDLVPEHYHKGVNITDADPLNHTSFDATGDPEEMNYQISYSQEITVNTLAQDVISVDLQRDLEELIKSAANIDDDDSVESELETDLLGKAFNALLSKMDDHIDTLLQASSELGGKESRIDLTINRLDEDKLNFTDLLATNEDVDYAETYIKMSSMETVYQASLSASSKILQPTLLDFIS